jgi:hypothetical protein
MTDLFGGLLRTGLQNLTTINLNPQLSHFLMAKLAVIVGSVRRDRQGIKVARWREKKYKVVIT